MSYQSNFNPYESNGTSIDAWGRPKSVLDYSLFHAVWTYDIPDSMWKIYENNVKLLDNNTSTKVISNNGRLVINSGPTSGNEAKLVSKRSPKYQPNRGHLFSTALGLPNPTGLGDRHFGLGTDENGVFFKLKSDGNLYAVIKSNSVIKREELITIPFTIDLSKGNIYDIQFQWRGVGNYFFYIGDPTTGKLELVHSINFLGTLDNELSIMNPAMPVHYHCESLGSDISIWVGCVDVTTEGGRSESNIYNQIVGSYTSVTNNEETVLAVKNNETFNGKINTRDLILYAVNLSCNDEADCNVYITSDPAALAGTIWTNVGSNENIQSSSGSNITFTNTQYVKKILGVRIEIDQPYTKTNPSNTDFFVSPGDYLIVTYATAGTAKNTFTTIEFGEEV